MRPFTLSASREDPGRLVVSSPRILGLARPQKPCYVSAGGDGSNFQQPYFPQTLAHPSISTDIVLIKEEAQWLQTQDIPQNVAKKSPGLAGVSYWSHLPLGPATRDALWVLEH